MAIAATTGRKIAVVARLLVNSVRKITSPVAAIIMKIIPIDEMGRRDSPSHKARPDFATADARLRPPPNKISTPHGNPVMSCHVIR